MQIVRDPETGYSKNYALVNYDNFDSSDTAISQMNGFNLLLKFI